MSFKYYAPSKKLTKIAICEDNEFVEKNPEIKRLLNELEQILIKTTYKEISKMLGEDIYDAMTSSWVMAAYHGLKIGGKIHIIKKEKFENDFLKELKHRFKNIYSEMFYESLSGEMLNYYKKYRAGDYRFDIIISNKKKDLELLIKSMPIEVKII